MKVKSYFIKNYIVSIISITVMYGIVAYISILTKQYVGVFVIALLGLMLLNRRVILYEDRVVIFQLYKKLNIKFDSIKSFKVSEYKPMLSKVGIPTIYVKLKDKKKEVFFYSSYPRESIEEVIEFALKKNNMICVDSNIKSILKKEDIQT